MNIYNNKKWYSSKSKKGKSILDSRKKYVKVTDAAKRIVVAGKINPLTIKPSGKNKTIVKNDVMKKAKKTLKTCENIRKAAKGKTKRKRKSVSKKSESKKYIQVPLANTPNIPRSVPATKRVPVRNFEKDMWFKNIFGVEKPKPMQQYIEVD